MKRIFLLFAFFIPLSSVSGAEFCRIKSSSRILVVDSKKMSFNDVATAENCSDKSKIKFLELIGSSKGTLRTSIFKSEFLEKVKITPNRIQISTLTEVLASHFNTYEKWLWSELKFISGKSAVTLSLSENIQFSCDFCKTLGSKNINMVIVDPLKSSNRTEWFRASLKVKAKALVANADISISNEGIAPDLFVTKEVLTDKPENFFTNREKLVFYRLTRPLQKGDILEFNTLTPANLVRQGRMATVVLKNTNMNLSGKAIPLGNGKLGEIIQLRNPISKKIMVGRVTDFNKVVIEL